MGRLITGVSVGIITVVVPLFISEYSPNDKYRGSLGTLFQVISCVATLGAYAMGMLLPYSTETEKIQSSQSWRLMFAVPVAIAII